MSTHPDLLQLLRHTLDDGRISRSEKRALGLVLDDMHPDPRTRRALIAGLFDLARERAHDPRDGQLLEWLEDAVGILLTDDPTPRPGRAWFGPEDPMVETVERFIRRSRHSLDVAVFTITDDRLSRALVQIHRAGVRVRILSDDDKSDDRGSDVVDLARAGLAVRLDRSPHHFHHKFAVSDETSVLTGSYNWTRGADRDNRENFLITRDKALVHAYHAAFQRMWTALD